MTMAARRRDLCSTSAPRWRSAPTPPSPARDAGEGVRGRRVVGTRPRAQAIDAPVVIVHDLPQARAALAAAVAADAAITLLSPPGAAAYWGSLYFQSLVRLASETHPRARFTAVLDCADRPGDVLASLRQGLADLVFHGSGEVRGKLAAIAEAKGARLLEPIAADLDLSAERDPAAACRRLFSLEL